MTEKSGKLQPIREFTAQVRRPGKSEIVGTAIAINFSEGLLVTCKHVVEAISKPCEKGTAVDVYFPLINGDEKLFPAKIHQMFDDHDDDVVILKLDAGLLPSGVEVAVISDAKRSEGYEFVTYGYRRLAKYQGLRGVGKILGSVDRPIGFTLHGEPIHLSSQNLDDGMSGSAVLDETRNLVVGIIAETWDSKRRLVDRDTGFAVDCEVMRIAPLSLELYEGFELPRTYDPPPNEQAIERAKENVLSFPLKPKFLPAEPPKLDEWVGRETLLNQLGEDYKNPTVHITSLIGFGGEGKSSLAYRWVTRILESDRPPEAAFWWNFYDNRSFEAMLEEAVTYLYGDVGKTWRSTSGRVEAIGALMREKRLLLVLDGFEVMQEAEGDRYGTVSNKDVLRLLELCAQGEHTSYCLVTSRAPLLDLLSHTAHIQRDVTRLHEKDGIDLLRNLGVQGDTETLKGIVNDWDGHALTLSLIGSYLRDVHKGDVGQYNRDTMFPQIEGESEGEVRYQGVSRILRRYDEHLSDADRAFLKLFSVFRLPVPESAFERVFRTKTSDEAINAPLTELNDDDFIALVKGLQIRRLIRKNADSYATHPLVRNHYLRLLESDSKEGQNAAHKAVAKHYVETAAYQPPDAVALQSGLIEPDFPILEDLQPYIEAVHHLCCAWAFDEAWNIYWNYIEQEQRGVLVHLLGLYEIDYYLLLEFFPDSDPHNDPMVSNPQAKSFILNEMSNCLMSMGQLIPSIIITKRVNEIDILRSDHVNICLGYINLSEAYVKAGQLKNAREVAEHAVEQVKNIEDKQRKWCERKAIGGRAWIAALYGESDKASRLFIQAEAIEREINLIPYLSWGIGIWHADHLCRKGNTNYARRVTQANLADCKRKNMKFLVSRCLRILGNIETIEGYQKARDHYVEALFIARDIDMQHVLIEILIAYGRWRVLHGEEAESGKAMLNEAIGYCTQSGYKLYEADTRVALAEVALKEGDTVTASEEAAKALAIGTQTGYHWAKVDAQKVLDQLDK